MQPKVLILAGGRSERFWPLSDKNLFPFLGKPLIKHQIERIRKAGFKDLVVVCNKGNLSVVKKFGVKTVLQTGEGQGAAILSVEEFARDQSLLIINANDIFEATLLKKIAGLTEDPRIQALLTGFAVQSYIPGGYLIVKNNLVKGIIEKPGEGNEPSGVVRLVVDYFKDTKLLFNYLRKIKKKRDDVYELAMDMMIKDGIKFNLLKYDDDRRYLKYPWHTLEVMRYFLEQIKSPQIDKSSQIAKNVIIKGQVVLEEGVKVFENAKIVGPSFIGNDTIVGNNTIIRQSMIGKNCVIGFSTEVTRSYVGEGCWFHSNYVGDSVLDKNVSLGAGAVLANLRLDERNIYSFVKGEKIDAKRQKLGAIIGENVRIGVNASVMPGVKIGKNSFVGAGVVLNKDLSESKFCCLGKQNLEVKKNIKSVKERQRERFRKEI